MRSSDSLYKLIDIWKFFKWLDEMSYVNSYEDFVRSIYEDSIKNINDFRRKLGLKETDISGIEAKHLVLSHWLTYIFDYQMPAKYIWERGYPIIACAVIEYLDRYSADEVIEKFSFWCEKYNFKHRFMKKHKLNEKVRRTLRILEKSFNKDIIDFMLKITSYGEDNDWVRKVACALYLLTYDESVSEYEACKILRSKGEFDKYYISKIDRRTSLWKAKLWHKRLWAALRDYMVSREIKRSLNKYRYYDAQILKRWENSEKFLDQLEVPGDIWNIRFYENVMKRLLEELLKDKVKESALGNPAKSIRILYNEFREVFKKNEFYPGQFDVTFDYARVFCNKKLCILCPLYIFSITKRLCEAVINSEAKVCPILILLEYSKTSCIGENCPVYREKLAGICEGKFME